jgi:hypothetical protein
MTAAEKTAKDGEGLQERAVNLAHAVAVDCPAPALGMLYCVSPWGLGQRTSVALSRPLVIFKQGIYAIPSVRT